MKVFLQVSKIRLSLLKLTDLFVLEVFRNDSSGER